MNNKTKILFLTSNPEDVDPLKLQEEIRDISIKIRSSDYRDSLDLEVRGAVRPGDLEPALLEAKPTIVHFSGHGNASGELILMDDSGKTKTVSPVTLKELFTAFKHNIQGVVLNACYSKKQGVAIAEVIDFVIVMNTTIGDPAAINFAASFYLAIGFGCSVKESFELGRVSLKLEGIPEENTPELIHRPDIDPASIYIVNKQQNNTEAVSDINNESIYVVDPANPEIWGTDGNFEFKWYNAPYGLLKKELCEMNVRKITEQNVTYKFLLFEGIDKEGKDEYSHRCDRLTDFIKYLNNCNIPLKDIIEVRVRKRKTIPFITFYILKKNKKPTVVFYLGPLVKKDGKAINAVQTNIESIYNFLDNEFEECWINADKIELDDILKGILIFSK